MSEPLRALIVEDSRDDIELFLFHLQQDGYEVDFERVETADEMICALERRSWDVVIADYSLRRFSGLDALELLKKAGTDLPFILVSAIVGEEAVVEAMRAGVHDCVMKANLARLAPAIRREIQECRIRLDQRRAEQALRESEALYRTLVDAIGDGINAKDASGRYLAINGELAGRLGLKKEDVIGKTAAQVLRDSERARIVEAQDRQVIQSGSVLDIEEEYPDRERAQVCHVRKAPIRNELGDVVGVVTMSRDITERKRADEAGLRLARHLQLLLQSTGEGLFGTDLEGRCTFTNRSASQMTGYAEHEVLGKNVHDLLHYKHVNGEAYPAEDCPMNVASLGESGRRLECEVFWRKDGSPFPIEYSSYPIIENGTVHGAVVTFSDITERKRAEDALRESEERYRTLVETIDDAICVKDADGRITAANPEYFARNGLSSDEVLGRATGEIYKDPDRARRGREQDLEVLNTGAVIDVQQEYSGRERATVCHVRKVPLRDNAGRVVGVVTVSRDVTARVRAEDALRESEAVLSRVAQGARSMMFRYELVPARHFSYVSSGVTTILGYAPEEFYGDPWILERLVSSDDLSTLRAMLRGEAQDRPPTVQVRHRDGMVVWVEIRVQPVMDVAGAVIAREGIIRDVTEQKQLEEKLLRAQELEAAGRIAAQVAHDFNNLLVPIAAYPELIKMQLPEGHGAIPYCDAMVDAAQQMVAINEDMLALGQGAPSERGPVDLNRLVRDMPAQMPGKWEGVTLEMDLCPDLPPVLGSSTQLMRVLTNLLSNAREAMGDGGKITVTTERVYLDRPAASYSQVAAGEYALLTVADDGPGIPSKIRDRIFDAFFTTKGAAKRPGTGLGLSIVRAIVDDHKGHVEVDSAEGGGTSFRVHLPLCSEIAEGDAAASHQMLGGSETILVADDDRHQRQALRGLLGALGYRVEVAPDGETAVARLLKVPVELLILDMIMPGGMDGVETYREILKSSPGQRAIMVSGYAEPERVREARTLGVGAFLRKPVATSKLAEVVRQELDRERAPVESV